MSVDELGTEPLGPPPPADGQADGVGGWRTDAGGRQFIGKPTGRGMIFRRGEETVEEAIARESLPKEERPKRKSKTPPRKPPAPPKVDLKELEQVLGEALASPAMICGMAGDQWAADHFTRQAPYLARNLIVAADHNPWLKKRLESAATGGDAAMKLVTLVGVGGALFAYAVPPVVWWLNLPIPDKGREMFGIPARREHAPEPPPPAAFPAAA